MEAGEWFDGRFRLDSIVGRGASGEVWRAIGKDGLSVIIKRLRGRAVPELRARFARELEVARRLGPPHFPTFVTGSAAADGACYIVWQESPGVLLGDWVDTEQPRRAARMQVVRGLLEALGALHAVGVVHRDLKPEHVLVTPEQTVCLLDLGVCRVDGAERLTSSRHMLGSAAFTAPEQVTAASAADERADLYAVGVIAFWLLGERLPFWAPNPEALLALKLLRDPPNLSDVVGFEVPPELDAWLGRMLERNPDARPRRVNNALLDMPVDCFFER